MRSVVAFLIVVAAGTACIPSESEDLDRSQHAASTHPIPWSVARHIWPSADPVLGKDFDIAADLGVKFVRTDLWWYEIEPQRGQINRSALESYSRAIDAAKSRGLELLVILSGAPDWAKQLYESAPSAFFDEFERYSAAVAEMVGPRARYYQIWNEPNHVIDFVDGEGDVQLFARGKKGITRGRQIGGAAHHPFKTFVNVLVDGHEGIGGASWETDLDFYMERAAASIDVLGIDYYPSTWSVGSWDGDVMDRLGRLGKKWRKPVAILETGFSTTACAMPWQTEQAQAQWIQNEIPHLRAKTNALMANGVHVEIVNWFKLDDRETSDCFDIEDHFGIVHTDRSKKVGYAALKSQIATFK